MASRRRRAGGGDGMSIPKTKKVKAKITRLVTEIAIVVLDRDGYVEEIEEVMEEIDTDEIEVDSILAVLSVHP